jgi:excinuclease ABC subunit B
VLVGINLLREGLDLPEVSLVAILDADKEGFLRGERALIQTIGRAARNVGGRVIMYADKETEAMRAAIGETNRRREIQVAYNERNNIEPRTIKKGVSDILIAAEAKGLYRTDRKATRETPHDPDELRTLIADLEAEMLAAAEELKFEYAAKLRDEIKDLDRQLREVVS